MNSEIFIHYGFRIKNKSIIYYDQLSIALNKAKLILMNYLMISKFYYSEIIIKLRVFKQNLKYINRFKTQ